MAALFSFVLFGAATLLFLVQPLAGKRLLPLVGGTPAAWNACLAFFQLLLLLGYLYADRVSRLTSRWQWFIHALASAGAMAACLLLEPDPTLIPADSEAPLLGVLAYLAGFVGVPFFVLSAAAPLVQRWYATRTQRDPYFLYASSNAGSFVGLLGYPFFVEPSLGVEEQWPAWVIGFVGLSVLILVCGWLARTSTKQVTSTTMRSPAPSGLRMLTWAALAAIPSSLLLGTTAHLTTDLAPIPLVWVVPLGLYLLSFVLVFSRWSNASRLRTGRFTAMVLVFHSLSLVMGATEPLLLTATLTLVTLVAVALLCHGELASDRPGEQHLTKFYLAMSAGGAAGGLFNLLLAPVLFSRLGLVEYPLMLVLAAMIRPRGRGGLMPLQISGRDAACVLGLAAAALGLLYGLSAALPGGADETDSAARLLRGGVVFGMPAVLVFSLAARPLRFALALAVLFVVGGLDTAAYGPPLHITRNFFGTLRVTKSADGELIRLVHGTTLHGQQWANRPGHPEPLMYYHRSGPIGRVLRAMPANLRQSVGVIGLGCGAMAAYAEPGEHWTFLEIDPAVARMASDPRYFTFLSTCKGSASIELGDARRNLELLPDRTFDVLVLDAFNSDAIPVHLLTREAFALYVRKLKRGGLLAFHLSNRYLDLPPMVAALAADHDPAFVVKSYFDTNNDTATGRFASHWAVAARDEITLKTAGVDRSWDPVHHPTKRVWTDSYSNLLSVWRGSLPDDGP